MNHRKPPKPENWDSPAGACRWCGCCIVGLKGPNKGKPLFNRHWHSKCAEQYRMIFWPNHARWKLLEKRGRVCEDCGAVIGFHARYDGPWRNRVKVVDTAELHHVVPLIDYNHDPANPYAAWRENNLVLLCHDCHLARHAALRQRVKSQVEKMQHQMSLNLEAHDSA